MSEVQVKDDSSGKKGRQKKQTLRVDFTPMVDMNMLLITFFMFCTTLLKPQVMNISMPSKEKAEEGSGTEFRASTALTIILGEDNNFSFSSPLSLKINSLIVHILSFLKNICSVLQSPIPFAPNAFPC